jgi:hypothetical protein
MHVRGVLRRCLRLAPLAIVLTALAGSAFASKPPAGSVHALPWGSDVLKLHKALGDRVKAVESGLYKVNTDRGRSLVTHGPDTRAEVMASKSTGSGVAAPDAERSPVCASDHYQRFLYAYPSGAANRLGTVAPGIQEVVRGMDATLNRDSLDSGGPTADYKVLCDSAGGIRVDAFASSGSDFNTIVSAARSAGFNLANANYTIFFDSSLSGYCGIGSFLPDETPGPTNINNVGGGYAIVYSGCWDVETAMHEDGHNQGAVQYSAPDSTGSGAHCYDEQDVMCYSPDGGDRHQSGTVERCSDRIHFDCNHDDYFNTAPAPGSYLATHWNLGSSANRFIGLGNGQGDAGHSIVKLRRRHAVSAAPNAAGGWRLFKLQVPSRSSKLKVTLQPPACGATGCANLDLYLRYKHSPYLYSYQCRSRGGSGSQKCAIRLPRSGKWYAGVYTYRAGAGTFRIAASY